jgi:hypothetical protein
LPGWYSLQSIIRILLLDQWHLIVDQIVIFPFRSGVFLLIRFAIVTVDLLFTRQTPQVRRQ